MSDDFQKLFKQQLQSAIITDESKKRMARVQGEDAEDAEGAKDAGDAAKAGTAAKKPAKARTPAKKKGPATKKTTPKKKAPAKKKAASPEDDSPARKIRESKDEKSSKATAPSAPETPENEPPAEKISIDLDAPLDSPMDEETEPTQVPEASSEKAPTDGTEVAAKADDASPSISIDLDAPLDKDPAEAAASAPPDTSVSRPATDTPVPASTTGQPAPVKAAPSRDKPAAEKDDSAARPARQARDKGPDAMREMVEDTGEEDLEHKFLTFHVGNEIYGIEISYVTEIIGIQKITDVPDMPDFIKGVINLRGEVIPVVEVRIRFGMESRPYDDRTCVVVVRLDNVAVGLVVDTVSEVLDIPPDHISPAPKLGRSATSRFVRAMGRVGEEVRILLDLEKFLYDGYSTEK